MAEFTRPEYASYVSLMKGLRLEHTCREGDWLYMPDLEDALGWGEGVYCYSGAADTMHVVPHLYEMPDEAVWLPQLADWVDMLEEVGYEFVQFFPRENPRSWECRAEGWHRRLESTTVWYEPRKGFPTREEAAARLWMAVTDKPQGA